MAESGRVRGAQCGSDEPPGRCGCRKKERFGVELRVADDSNTPNQQPPFAGLPGECLEKVMAIFASR